MSKDQIACCYFPTNIVFVDDGEDYLDSLRLNLDESLSYSFYYKPLDALKFLKEEYKPNPFIKKWMLNLKETTLELGELEEKELTHSYISVDLSTTHKEIYSPSRFDEISLIVVDYSMPELSGIEFCRQLANIPAKKIMLTGQAGYKIGVQALNEGLIDRFITKDEEDFTEILNSAIDELQEQYFQDISKVIIENLSTNPHCCLGDPTFIDFFNKFREENNIIESYLVNDTGSFLMLDLEGNPSWLVVKSERNMDCLYDSAYANHGPDDIVNDVKNKKKLLFLFKEEDEGFDSVEEWRKYLHPATEIVGKNNKYYYSFIKGPSVYNITPEKIASYKNYLSNRYGSAK